MNIPSAFRESFNVAPSAASLGSAVRCIAAWAALSMAHTTLEPQRAQAQDTTPAAASTSKTVEKQLQTADPLEAWEREQLPLLLQKLQAEIPALDNDAFAVREGAQKKIHAVLLEIVQFINPRPPEIDAAILKIIAPKKEVHSVEQISRLRYANALMQYETANAPTRIALLANDNGQRALSQLQAQTSIAVTLSNVPALQRLQTLRIDQKKNSYANVLEQLCKGLDAYPVSGVEPDTVALQSQDEKRRTVFSDATGRFLCVQEEAGEDGIPVLRVFCDPQMALATVKHAEAVNTHGHYHVVVEMTKFQWPTGEGIEPLGKPELKKSTADYCPPNGDERWIPDEEKNRRGIVLHGALLAQPKEYELPLDGTAVNASSQIAAATYNEEKGAVSVRAKASNPIDTPTTFWIEAAVNCNTFTLLDDAGKVLYTGRGTLVYRPDVGHVFDIDLPATVKPAQVRMRGYEYLTDWNRSSSGGDAVLLELPKK